MTKPNLHNSCSIVTDNQKKEQHYKYFKVFYSKDVNKKKRVFSQGFLACENKKTKLFNNDGQIILVLNQKNNPQLEQQYILNRKFVILVDSQVKKQDYISGKIFLPQVQLKPITNDKKNKPSKKENKQQNLLTGNFNKETITLQNNLQIDHQLYVKLRQHQIIGVQFMYDCLMGHKNPMISGCILADFMGLGKTLQTITLIYSLLKMKKIFKIIVISPLTLVSVWQRQCKKWLDGKLTPLIGLGDGQQLKNTCIQFANNQYRMLVLSYQSFYKYIDILDRKCELIIFDEGHRLKNKNSKSYKKILKFSCRKRILLTGTPLQNNLDQLYTCISIVNPTLFLSQQLFKNVFQKPILIGMGKKATQIQRKTAVQRTIQLANKIKQFSLRRKADTLQKYLPIKREYLVMFKMTQLQRLWYQKIRKRKQSQSDVLCYLNLFRKLFSHPQIFKKDRVQHQDSWQFIQDTIYQISYKTQFILDVCRKKSFNNQKVIIVSYFTSTLDFISKLLLQQNISYCKLDGRSDGKQRQNIVTSFQKQKSVLLLSGKAGGTGLTLICARTMIMVEPDWNPSNDAQVIGRIWRQGQTEEVSIYRLIMISTFEERIVQRQQLKISLSQKLIDQSKNNKEDFDFFNMKKLFVDPSQKSILFKQEQNCLNRVKYSNQIQSKNMQNNFNNQKKQNNKISQFGDGINGLTLDGVVFLYCKRSHQDDKKSIKLNNQFDDGSFLINGLLNKDNDLEQKQNINQEQDQDDYEQQQQNQLSNNEKQKIQEKDKNQNNKQQKNQQKTVVKKQKFQKKLLQQKIDAIKKPKVNSVKQDKNEQNIQKRTQNNKQIKQTKEHQQNSHIEQMQTHLNKIKKSKKKYNSDVYLITKPIQNSKINKYEVVDKQFYNNFQQINKNIQLNTINNSNNQNNQPKTQKIIKSNNLILNKIKRNQLKLNLNEDQTQSSNQATVSNQNQQNKNKQSDI